MDRIQLILLIGWLILILSMFYDPISAHLTEPGRLFGPDTANACYQFQEQTCLPITPYPLGARIFWGIILPLAIVTLLVFGHEAWRRICPLSLAAQIPRKLGLQRKDTIPKDSWLGRNHAYLQFGLLFVGLNIRLLWVNSDRLLLGIFLLLTILGAVTVGFLWDGKPFCQKFCPFAPVHAIFSEPSGLLGSKAHTEAPLTITQSTCRTVDQNGYDVINCVGCQANCIDIDAENAYWSRIDQPGRKMLYYAYLGLVLGFYLYFGLYSGNWAFLSGGVWNETNQLMTLLGPGLYISGNPVPIPKLIAVPLTLFVFCAATYVMGLWIEKSYRRYNARSRRPLKPDQVQHQLFTLFTFVAFNALFFLGVRPTLGWLPWFIEALLSWAAVLVSGFWVVKVWRRSFRQYSEEKEANSLRRQLRKLPIDFSELLEGRSLEDLKPGQLYVLAQTVPGASRQIIEGLVTELLESQAIHSHERLESLIPMCKQLGMSEEEYQALIERVGIPLRPKRPPTRKVPPTRIDSDNSPGHGRTKLDRTPSQRNDHTQLDGNDHTQLDGNDHTQLDGNDHTQLDGDDHTQLDGNDLDRKQPPQPEDRTRLG